MVGVKKFELSQTGQISPAELVSTVDRMQLSTRQAQAAAGGPRRWMSCYSTSHVAGDRAVYPARGGRPSSF
jgi:hypothetical protein